MRETLRRPMDGMPMVFIPAGEFIMGITDEEYDLIREKFGYTPYNERPQRSIELDAYYIDQFAVSNEQFCAFLNALSAAAGVAEMVEKAQAFNQASKLQFVDGRAQPAPGCDRYPAVVPWDLAKRYAEWANADLPTEAQWERAARGADGRRFPWGDKVPEPEDFLCNLGPNLKEVDCCPKGRSPAGCYNMAGNTWDWCLDRYQPDCYSIMSARNPLNLEAEGHPVYRGGGYTFRSPYFHRTTVRPIERAETCKNPVGFRCVISLAALVARGEQP